MDTKTGHLIEDADGVSVALLDRSVDGADVAHATTKGRQAAVGLGLSPLVLDELAELAAERVRAGGLRLMGDGASLIDGDQRDERYPCTAGVRVAQIYLAS